MTRPLAQHYGRVKPKPQQVVVYTRIAHIMLTRVLRFGNMEETVVAAYA